ncbi:diguanylate cyclase/phosphodiesterase (GGDEF & EAL domains) with PAS/PAC sensor(s) [Leptospirillum ferriphilum]|uniref:Diguanylate cyclase/phosphodiesterase (GGDEF & EAL domains) with PAS/PAC sensor(S) n=1 Tax=Leptospirillum ferriphilum TaxID=178606 RepID=A0A094WB70_9BACT|nr:bifunctional diguanylate cyclase/phosphodiesterase [Leptospirillum ferriphilum]KGA93740.1 diguanylate cyclase/phosphodiesterase (GGDEF & EAL domains) with PAS/PAC sensor(s) [Leptospirillum ferriphilum]
MNFRKNLRVWLPPTFLGVVFCLFFLSSFFYFQEKENDILEKQHRIHDQISQIESFLISVSMLSRNHHSFPTTPGVENGLLNGYRIQAETALSFFENTSPSLSGNERKELFRIKRLLSSSRRYAGKIGTYAITSEMVGFSLRLLRQAEKNLDRDSLEMSSIIQTRTHLFWALGTSMIFFVAGWVFWQRRESQSTAILHSELAIVSNLVITSNVIQRWNDYMKDIFLSMSEILPMDCLFSVFTTAEGSCSVNVFWSYTPSSDEQEKLERVVHRNLFSVGGERYLSDLHFEHVFQNQTRHSHHLSRSFLDFFLFSRTLFLDTPKVGGILGIGILPSDKKDPAVRIVTDSILPSTLNALGSAKAISDYTRKMEYHAVRDPLTCLYNQRVFWDFLEDEIARAGSRGDVCSILFIDIDDFKQINDRFGHAFGDRFLLHVTEILSGVCSSGDILCRFGGDEFSVILPGEDTEIVRKKAEDIRDAVRSPLYAEDRTPVSSSVSIGVATWPHHGRESRDIFRVADHAMYQAKKGGKDAVIVPTWSDVQDAFQTSTQKRLWIVRSIHDKKPVPFFQPIQNLANGQVLGCEVLSRIPEEDGHGFIPAAKFVDVAEDSGLIVKLDYIVMEKAFQAKIENNFHGLLFVNMSPKVLFVPDFLNTVRSIVRKTGVSPTDIVFEIVERDAVRNLSMMDAFLKNLKSEGFRFAVDDFGSGYASLSYLRMFPIDFLKIDGSFVTGAGNGNSVDGAIVRSIVTLGKEMGIRVIGEHIENLNILSMANKEGIGYGQGYHIGRPSPNLQTVSIMNKPESS